jgi:hypothetical protein
MENIPINIEGYYKSELVAHVDVIGTKIRKPFLPESGIMDITH